MSRKRKSDQEASTNSSAVAEAPAENLPVAELAPEDSEATSFADKVGQTKREPIADPFGIAKDNLAGVRLFESRQDRQVAIKFGEGRPEDKPSQAVIDKLKENGYRWNPMHKIWTHPIRPESALGTRIDAEKLYQEVRLMIREEKGIEAGQEQGVPF
jgi:hypothetical protein